MNPYFILNIYIQTPIIIMSDITHTHTIKLTLHERSIVVGVVPLPANTATAVVLKAPTHTLHIAMNDLYISI